MMGTCTSTLDTQTLTAASVKNVSAHWLVHRARTKIRVGDPLAKHVPVDNTKNKMHNLVVHHVVLGNTMVNIDKLPNLVAKMIAMPAPTLHPIKVHV
jgi:hypothetical protein